MHILVKFTQHTEIIYKLPTQLTSVGSFNHNTKIADNNKIKTSSTLLTNNVHHEAAEDDGPTPTAVWRRSRLRGVVVGVGALRLGHNRHGWCPRVRAVRADTCCSDGARCETGGGSRRFRPITGRGTWWGDVGGGVVGVGVWKWWWENGD